jgi:hypothetical protein
VFTARYALSPYIKQIRFVFKGLIGRSRGLLLASLLCITPWEDISTQWGCWIFPCVENAGLGEETSAYVLCECEALATLRHICLGSFVFDPKDIRYLSLRAICNFFRRTGLSWLGPSEGAQRVCEGLRATGPWGLDPHLLIFNYRSHLQGTSSILLGLSDPWRWDR